MGNRDRRDDKVKKPKKDLKKAVPSAVTPVPLAPVPVVRKKGKESAVQP